MRRQDGEVLLVEDDPEEVELTLRALHQSNARNEITVSHDGVEAIEYLLGPTGGTERRPLPVLVLLDLKLPRVDGVGVLERIRADRRTQLLPVVVLTSSHEDRDIIASYRAGANGYVLKPVDFSAFRAAVHDLSRYWLGVNEAPPGPVPDHPAGGLRP